MRNPLPKSEMDALAHALITELNIVQRENTAFVVCTTDKGFGHAWQVAAVLKDAFGDLAILRGDEMIWNVRDGVVSS